MKSKSTKKLQIRRVYIQICVHLWQKPNRNDPDAIFLKKPRSNQDTKLFVTIRIQSKCCPNLISAHIRDEWSHIFSLQLHPFFCLKTTARSPKELKTWTPTPVCIPIYCMWLITMKGLHNHSSYIKHYLLVPWVLKMQFWRFLHVVQWTMWFNC